MKKYISIILSILCILSLVGCSKKEVETMYIQGVMVDGVVYSKYYQPMPAEVDESAIIGYIESYTDTYPKKDGQTNISKDLIGAPYAKVEGGIAILYENEWYLCTSDETSEGAPLAPDVSDKDLESISYIEVMSGLTGQRIKVKDSASVQKVMNDIESLKYKKKNSVEEVGYAYRIRFYNENDDELGRIFITEENGHQISYDGYYYLVESDQNIDVDYLEELLMDAPPAEPGDEGDDELQDNETFVVTNVFANERKALLANDGSTIADILENASWNTEGTTDCLSNIEVEINGIIYKYHSDCGTFNDRKNQRYLSLESDMKEKLNTLLAEYISLSSDEAPIE